MKIEQYTDSQQQAIKRLDQGHNVFLTGKPGTGKTVFIDEYCRQQIQSGKNVLVTATTGIAASHLEKGRTLHSALNWSMDRRHYDYKKCISELGKADILVVDEVSMLNRSILLHLRKCLDSLDRKPQLIMVGDFFQLPPVPPKGGVRVYPFETSEWRSFDLYPCMLKEVVRQKDKEFIKMLGLAMLGDSRCIEYFNMETSSKEFEDAITVCTENKDVKIKNKEKIRKLKGGFITFDALEASDEADYDNLPIEKNLVVARGMRVMTLRNDPDGRFQNGSLGTVRDFGEAVITVGFDSGNVVDVHRMQFEADSTTSSAGRVMVQQFPLRGAFATTIHKSQGQTFERVNIIAPHCWDPGHMYVALSRACSVKGIHLANPISSSDLKSDPRVLRFYNSSF